MPENEKFNIRDVRYELDGQLFIWDRIKAESNVVKHGVTFEEAATVLLTAEEDSIDDEEHSAYEQRFRVTGLSTQRHALVVSFCFRESETAIRIISARKATKIDINRIRGQ